MGRRNILITLFMALAATALFWGVDPGRAHADETRQSPAITGKFRDPQNLPQKRRITKADREAAAARLAAQRAAALSSATTPKTTSPPQKKGGPK